MDWAQILDLWYQLAVATPGWEVQKYPRNPTAYIMKDADDNIVEHIDGVVRVFPYYIPSLTGEAQPRTSKKTQAATPLPSQEKPIALQAIEMSTGDVITLPNISNYDEAMPAVVKFANIPNDWTVTIIENSPVATMVACAPPSYGSITVEKYQALQRRGASELAVVPKARAVPKAVMVVMTYIHMTPQRKLNRKTISFTVEEDDDKQLLLDAWIRLANKAATPWPQIARKMSKRAEDYGWFTGTDDPLQFPWYDCEAITIKDPPRSSTDIRPADIDDPEPDGPSFGPGADGPSFGPDTGGTSGPQVSNASGASLPGGLGENPDPSVEEAGDTTDAQKYNTSTVNTKSKEKVDVTFKCLGRTVVINVESGVKESMIQRLVANTLRMNLEGYWVATVTEGFGGLGLCARTQQ
jgi:hypothetical protein